MGAQKIYTVDIGAYEWKHLLEKMKDWEDLIILQVKKSRHLNVTRFDVIF